MKNPINENNLNAIQERIRASILVGKAQNFKSEQMAKLIALDLQHHFTKHQPLDAVDNSIITNQITD